MQNVLAGRFLIGKEKYTINCPVKQKKTTGKANGETVSENDCYKVKKNV